MKFQTYKYEEKNVKLDFSFQEDKNIKEDKKIFIKLLEQAITDLKNE